MLVTTIMAFLMIAGCGGNTDQARADRAAKGEIVISMGKYMINGGYDPTSGWGMWAADPFHSALYTRNDKKRTGNGFSERCNHISRWLALYI